MRLKNSTTQKQKQNNSIFPGVFEPIRSANEVSDTVNHCQLQYSLLALEIPQPFNQSISQSFLFAIPVSLSFKAFPLKTNLRLLSINTFLSTLLLRPTRTRMVLLNFSQCQLLSNRSDDNGNTQKVLRYIYICHVHEVQTSGTIGIIFQ